MIFFESEVEKLTDKSILNPVKNFDKPNESAHFEVEKMPINRLAICRSN